MNDARLMKLGQILHMEKGKRPENQSTSLMDDYLPYVDIEAFEQGIIKRYASTKNSLLCDDGDLLIVCDGSRSGLTGRAIKGVVGSTLSKIRADGMITAYLHYFLKSKYLLLNTKKKGTGTPHLNAELLKTSLVFVPSHKEQERIVARIDEQFSVLDKSVETLQTIKRQLAVYRQAVLKSAYEGRYTKSWRTLHPNVSPICELNAIKICNAHYKDTSGDDNIFSLVIPDTWLLIRFGDVFEVEVGATPSRRNAEYWNGNINWVSSGEVHFNTITHTDEMITEEGLNHSSTNIHPIGTIMLAMIGEGKTRGQAAILNTQAAHNQNTAAILVSKTSCQPKYVYYYLQMNYENTRRIGSGNNQKALNKERVRAMQFPFTSFQEQALIVQAIESRLSVCDSIEQTVDSALTHAAALKQSILKEAFEGRLA